MSVWKEDAYMMEQVEKLQDYDLGRFKFIVGCMGYTGFLDRGKTRGFALEHLTPEQKEGIDYLRKFCKENKNQFSWYGDKDPYTLGTWNYKYDMCEGPYGWVVEITMADEFLGLKVTAYSKQER